MDALPHIVSYLSKRSPRYRECLNRDKSSEKGNIESYQDRVRDFHDYRVESRSCKGCTRLSGYYRYRLSLSEISISTRV